MWDDIYLHVYFTLVMIDVWFDWWVVEYTACGALRRVENGRKSGKSYGMELPRVGAFTDFGGSGYRNPVQIWA